MANPRSFNRHAGPGPTLILLLVTLVAMTACDLASPVPASPDVSPTSERCDAEEVSSGGIAGKVVDPEGNPLNDIYIFIQAADGFTGSTRTIEDGSFAASGVSGVFQITTTDIDYAEVVRRVTVPCGELVEVELVLTSAE